MSGVSFVSETEADEIRKKRQEEWEKVRKEDDPLGKVTFVICLLAQLSTEAVNFQFTIQAIIIIFLIMSWRIIVQISSS